MVRRILMGSSSGPIFSVRRAEFILFKKRVVLLRKDNFPGYFTYNFSKTFPKQRKNTFTTELTGRQTDRFY